MRNVTRFAAVLLALGAVAVVTPLSATRAQTGAADSPIQATAPATAAAAASAAPPAGGPSPAQADAPSRPEGGAVPLTAEDVNVWLDGYLPFALGKSDIAGAVVAIVKDGEILTLRGFGYADVAARKPVDPRLTLFRPGSVSKLLTWTAVMQLVEQGKIDLDADVNQYLDFKYPPYDGKPITMRNMMQHAAGFEEQVKGLISKDPKISGFEVHLKRWLPERVFAPGTTPAYSNYATSLAGYVIQRVSGERFTAYVAKHIFEPLDMVHSTFEQPLPPALEPLMSKGYVLGSGEAHGFEIVGPAPAGALSSPGLDMAHFMIAHLQGGEYQGRRILTAKTIEQMHNSPLTLLPPLNRMELGFFETNINGIEVIGHLGDLQYFHTSLHLFMPKNVGFYVSFNSAGAAGGAQALRTALFQDFADRYFPAAGVNTARVDKKTAAEHAALLKGTWVNSRGSVSTFLSFMGLLGQTKMDVGSKGELVTSFKGLNGQPIRWVEVEPFLWQDSYGHERLAAKVENGRVVRFALDSISPFMVFYRAPWYLNSSWLTPLLYFSLGALSLTALLWPVAAIIRRRYRATLALDARGWRAYRIVRIGAILMLAALSLWLWTVTNMFKDLSRLSVSGDSLLTLTQIFGLVAFFGGFAAILYNLWAVWTGAPRWLARIWSLVLVISGATVLWVAFVFHLLGLGVNY